MVLYDGSETVFKEGHVCVQRGTDHVRSAILTVLIIFSSSSSTASRHEAHYSVRYADRQMI